MKNFLPNRYAFIPGVFVVILLFVCSILQAQQTAISLIKTRLTNNQTALNITADDVNSINVKVDYTDVTTGIRHMYAEQTLNGLAITQTDYSLHTINAIQTDASNLISLQQYAIKGLAINVTSATAIDALKADLLLGDITPVTVKQAATGTAQYTVYSRSAYAAYDIPCRLIYYNSSRLKTLTPAWEIQMMDVLKQHYYVGYVDVTSGVVLYKADLMLHCNFDATNNTDGNLATKAVPFKQLAPYQEITNTLATTNNASRVLTGAVNQYRAYPPPFESPNSPGSAQLLVSQTGDPLSSPDGWQKVAGKDTYFYTRGNNLWAYQDPSPGPLGGVPSADPTRTAYANNGLAGTPPVAEPMVFDYKVDTTKTPSAYRNAAIVNLFYWNNIMHDMAYYFGFTEDAANFQASPIFGAAATSRSARPSAQNDDAIQAQAQDGGGTNNANFLTLPDGTAGQMQMYLWTASTPDSSVKIISSTTKIPAANTKMFCIEAAFNTTFADSSSLFKNPVINRQFVIIQKNAASSVGSATEGCSTGQQSVALPPANNVTGKIVLIDRGSCSFVEKVLGAQEGGAAGAIVINNIPGSPLGMGGADAPGNGIKIPAVMISQADGKILKDQIIAGATIMGSMQRSVAPPQMRDGDLDNSIMAHEYGHGISTRLCGGGGALGSLGGSEQGGEGWSDYLAMYMVTTKASLTAATPDHKNGVLPTHGLANYVVYQPFSGPGLRQFPYSIDMALNPATFGYVLTPAYAEIHAVGFVWATILYDFLQLFIDIKPISDNFYDGANPTATFEIPAASGGNNVATRLILEGIKIQPTSPTFVQERDAILKADSLLYKGVHACQIWKVFARRGLGFSAVSGTNALGDEVEAFDMPLKCNPTQKLISITTAGKSKVTNGLNSSYTITVKNLNTNAITGLVVTDTLVSSLIYSSASDAPVVNGKIITWTIDLGANETKVLTLNTVVSSTKTSTILFGDDMENGPANWDTTSTYTNTQKFSLLSDATQAFSGKRFWFMPDVSFGGSNATLTLKKIQNITSTSELVFFHKYATEPKYDGGVVEISTDSLNWTYLPPTAFSKGNYNGIITQTANPAIGTADHAAFTGASSDYVTSIASLKDYAGKSVYVRFRFTSDVTGGAVAGGGWWIDDVYLLNNRTEAPMLTTARTDNTTFLTPLKGVNAYAVTSAFIIGSPTVVTAINAINLTGIENNGIINLKWEAMNELNTDYYNIERKSLNETTFQVVGSVKAINAGSSQNYQFNDKNVAAGQSYLYRISQIAKDGKAVYTNNIYLKVGGKSLQIMVFPNPAKKVANLSITNPAGTAVNLVLSNVSGSKIAALNIGTGKNMNYALPVGGLASGTYWLQVNSAEESITTQVIIIK